MTIRVVLADDQALIRAGFHALIESADDLEVAGEAGNGRQAIDLLRSTRADVVVMDIRMPEMDGLAATRQITGDDSLAGVRVLILTTFEMDENVLLALRAGASGFLNKGVQPDDLLDAIRTVAGGEALLSPGATRTLITRYLAEPEPSPPAPTPHAPDVLTDRERETLGLVAGGLSNEEIAARLFVSPLTAKTHVNRAMTKLGARDRAQLVIIAYETGLVRPGDASRRRWRASPLGRRPAGETVRRCVRTRHRSGEGHATWCRHVAGGGVGRAVSAIILPVG